MTTVLSKKGQIVLPAEVRRRLDLKEGDDFEVLVDEDDGIRLRRVARPPNKGLLKHLRACPAALPLPARQSDLPREPELP